jgi:hypothetical protein
LRVSAHSDDHRRAVDRADAAWEKAEAIVAPEFCTQMGAVYCSLLPTNGRCATCPRSSRAFPLRLMVVGSGRHGKDTVAEILRDDYGASFVSSSWFMAEKVVLPYFAGKYASVQECYDDRANHRSTWFDLIAAYNKDDATTLGRAIFAEYDLYVGNRNAREFHALRNAGAFDASIWVDASQRVEYFEPRSSLTIEPWMADYVVDNNGTVDDLRKNLAPLMTRLLKSRRSAPG